jgi:hypothetical protein
MSVSHCDGLTSADKQYLSTTPPIQENFDALSELLKLTNNIIRFHPHVSSDEWDKTLDPLLWPTLALFHSLPTTDYAPPLTHCLHVLFAIPFIHRLLDTWHSVPAATPSGSGGVMQGIWNRLGSISITSTSSHPERRQPETSVTGANNPNPVHSPLGAYEHSSREFSLPARKEDPTAFNKRVVQVLEKYLNRRLPALTSPDDQLESDLPVDEHLPPILLLLARAAEGSEPSRAYLRDLLLPQDL